MIRSVVNTAFVCAAGWGMAKLYRKCFPRYSLQTQFYPSASENSFESPVTLAHSDDSRLNHDWEKTAIRISDYRRAGTILIEVQAYPIGGRKGVYYMQKASLDRGVFPGQLKRYHQCMEKITHSTLNEGVDECMKRAGFSKISSWVTSLPCIKN